MPAVNEGPTGENGVGPYQEAVLSGPDIAQPHTPSQTTTHFPSPPSDEEAIAAKRELVPAADLTATLQRLAPDQAKGREIETIAAPGDSSAPAADGGAAPLPPPLPDYLPVDGAPSHEVGRDSRPLAEQVAEAGEQIAPAQQHGREIATVAGDGWETTPAADLLVRRRHRCPLMEPIELLQPQSAMPYCCYISHRGLIRLALNACAVAQAAAPQQQQPPAAQDAIAMKRDAAPAEEVAAAAERIAPQQAHAPEIESVATDPVDRPQRVEDALTSAPSDASDIKVSSLHGKTATYSDYPCMRSNPSSLLP